MELFTTSYYRWIGYHCQALLQSPFTRETYWVRTRGKRRTDCMILSVKTDNIFPRVGQKFGIAQRLEGCVALHLWRPDLFSVWEYSTAHAISEIITQADIGVS